MIVGSVIDGHAIAQLLWSASAASLAVCIGFALAFRMLNEASAARRTRRRGAMIARIALSALPIAVCLAAIAAGLLAITSG
jgi:uncharacterized membrane protein